MNFFEWFSTISGVVVLAVILTQGSIWLIGYRKPRKPVECFVIRAGHDGPVLYASNSLRGSNVYVDILGSKYRLMVDSKGHPVALILAGDFYAYCPLPLRPVRFSHEVGAA